MDTEREEQAFAPAQFLGALQTASFCRLTAPNCQAGKETNDIPFSRFFFTLEKVPLLWGLFTNIF